MITGFNTDVKHAGRVFHVQTEDKGRNNPRIETLIYVGGQILDSIRYDYAEKIRETYDEALVTKLMEEQHRRVVRDIKTGKYDEGGESLEDMLSRKTLDEVVLAYLNNGSATKEEMILVLDNEGDEFRSGSKIHLKVSALSREGRKPIPRVKLSVKILSVDQPPALVHEGYTDASGRMEISFSIPDLGDGTFTLQLEGEHANFAGTDIKYLIRND